MLFKTHLAFAIFLLIPLLNFFSPANPVIFILIFLTAALLPDIDHPKSKLGRFVKPIGFLFEHRGFFHSGFALLLFTYLAYQYLSVTSAIAVFIGYASHIMADTFSHQGIMPLHPLSKFRIKGFMNTGGFLEVILLFALILADVYLIIKF
ncbi:metal-dependent hydrolase [Candidatus Woesearchaeota archaeon]|jgi:inner membrane protein|nr:metal-dependent hydrolase [Candidatus Woesearchaeota archaeon]MBT7367211.1 metal-dependent hydrolase [Candidatus Woesearchaeota archaeon]